MSAPLRVLAAGALAGATQGTVVRIEGDAAHHLTRVSRARVGDRVVAFDGTGTEAAARVSAVSPRGESAVELCLESDPKPGVVHDTAGAIWLQGYPKGDKLDAVVRQATELGVRAIWPVYTERSVPKPSGREDSRSKRSRAIALSAAQQCGRADVPEIRDAVDLDTALAALPADVTLRLMPWEESRDSLAGVLRRASAGQGCAVLVGPEGGITVDEAERARRSGFVAVALGPRIWRTETVAPALLAVLSYARGDLGR